MNTMLRKRALQRTSLAALACLLGVALAADAQTTRGSIAGTIRDAQGAAVPGATIELNAPRRGDTQVTTSNETGDFVFLNLLPDTYRLKVTMDSFKTVERENVVLNATDQLTVGVITLELGALTETVTVTSRVVEVQSGTTWKHLATCLRRSIRTRYGIRSSSERTTLPRITRQSTRLRWIRG